MYLLAGEFESIHLFIAVVSLLVGWLVSYLGKLLDDKKNIAILQVKVKNLEDRVDDLEQENRDKRRHNNQR